MCPKGAAPPAAPPSAGPHGPASTAAAPHPTTQLSYRRGAFGIFRKTGHTGKIERNGPMRKPSLVAPKEKGLLSSICGLFPARVGECPIG